MDDSMRGYEQMAVKTGQSLAALNVGQSLIITIGLVTVMVMAAMEVQAGTLTVGDFVMVQAYMIQITMPLGFLGTVYREIRQALVDMGEMFDLLHQPSEIQDRPGANVLNVQGGEVVLENVEFHYDPTRPILKGISLSVPAGKPWRWSGRLARGNRPSGGCCSGFTMSPAGRSGSTGKTCAM